MKHAPLFVLMLLLTLTVDAQQGERPIDLKLGPELMLANDMMIPGIFGHDERGYYAYSYDYRPAVEYLDKSLRTRVRKHIDLSPGIRNRQLVGVTHFHDTIYLFTKETHMRSVMLFVETIDKTSMEQNNDSRLVLNVPNIKGWESDFTFRVSRQKEKLLVVSKLDVLSKNLQIVHLMMFGPGLTLEWENEEQVVYPKNPPRRSIVKVSDEGDAYFISLLDDQNLRSLWDGIKNRYHMIAVTENGKFKNSYALMLPDLYIRGVMIEPGDNHTMVCAGFYSPTHFRGNIDGIFYFELDNRTGDFNNQTLMEFKAGLLKEAIAEESRTNPEELFEFRIRQLIRRDNGDFIMVSENQYDQTYDTYQNLIVTSISPGGFYNWSRVIHKRQDIDQHNPVNYSSFSVHAPKATNKVHFIFNERDKNEFLEPGERLKTFYHNNKANLMVITIGPMGEMSRSIVYRKTSRRMKTPVPLQMYDKLNNEMIIPILRMKRYNYLLMEFNDL